MRRNMDTIQFERRAEIQEMIKVIDKYIEENPKEKDNKTLNEFYNLLDVMYMVW